MPTQQNHCHSHQRTQKLPLFAPGQICYPDEVQAALHQAGMQGITLIGRHVQGEWGHVDEKRRLNWWAITHPQDGRRLPVISRFILPDGRQVAVITRHVHTPAKRQTRLTLWPPPVIKKLAEHGVEMEQGSGQAQPSRKRKKRPEYCRRREARK